MTREQLYEILGDLDETYLTEAKKPYEKKKGIAKWGGMAACFGLAAVLAAVVFPGLSPREDQQLLGDVNQQEAAAEYSVCMDQIHMNLISNEAVNMEDAVNVEEAGDGDGKMYYDPKLYEEAEWGEKEIEGYFGKDLTPAYIPEGLTASAGNQRMTVWKDKDGTMVEDVLWLSFYHDYYEDGSPKLTEDIAAKKGVSVKASKIGIQNECYFLMPENKRKISDIHGTEVTFGYRLMPYGPYDPDTHEPAGYYDLYVAEFACDGIWYQVVTEQLKEQEIVKIVSSIICGEEVVVEE